jgi:hypothetical protein
MSKNTKTGHIRLYSISVLYKGDVSKVPISLEYKTKDSIPIHMDITALRPNPSTFLKEGKTYKAILEFDSILFPCEADREEVKILRMIKLPRNRKIVNIR